MASREALDLKVKLLEQLAKQHPDDELRNAAARVKTALQDFDTAVTANKSDEAEKIAKQIDEIAEPASQVAAQISETRMQTTWSFVGMGVLGLVFVGLAWFLVHYVSEVGFVKLSTIEGTRPLLVIAAIVSTIAFGGALLVGSLFSSEGSFEDRFRHSREIFLVFSGIFGTVIGFYFGAGDSKGPQLGVDATLEEATVVAYATGGTPPYKVTISYGSKGRTKTEETKTGWARFPFDKKTDYIVPLKVSATDNKNLQGSSTVDINKDNLKKAGWVLPEETPAGQLPSGEEVPKTEAGKTSPAESKGTKAAKK